MSRATLLIVDDEARILSALRRTLRHEGYRILTADSPRAALELVDSEAVDVVLTDHKMPGMSGTELLAEVARRAPGARRLLITGWSESVPPSQLAALGVAALITKPWEDAELKQVLREQTGG